jgi:hypothetical protein
MIGAGTLPRRQASAPASVQGLENVKPLPIWFFAFEGFMGAAYDVCHIWHGAWMVLVAFGAVNAIVGLTVLRRRVKLVKAMLKNGRTRKIAFGLVALRVGAHLALAALGADVHSPIAHVALGSFMIALTMGLLWFDQRVTFRALGLRSAA